MSTHARNTAIKAPSSPQKTSRIGRQAALRPGGPSTTAARFIDSAPNQAQALAPPDAPEALVLQGPLISPKGPS